MNKLMQIIVASACIAFVNGNIRIEDVSYDQTINLGEPLSLYCTVSTTEDGISEGGSWKTCTWTQSKDSETCLFTYQQDGSTWKIDDKCTGTMDDAVFVGGDDIQTENLVCGRGQDRRGSRRRGSTNYSCEYSVLHNASCRM